MEKFAQKFLTLKMVNRIPNAPIKHTCEVLEYIRTLQVRNKEVTSELILVHFGKTPAYTKEAIQFLIFLDIVFNNETILEIKSEFAKLMDGNRETTRLLLKNELIRYRPFIEFISFTNNEGKKTDEAAKLVKDIYNIKNPEKVIATIFSKWINDFAISTSKPSNLRIDNFPFSEERVDSELAAQEFLRSHFGEKYVVINRKVLDDLQEAILDCESDPSKALNDAGRALEDFLRIDFAPEIDLSKFSGIVQIADRFNSQKVSAKKHNGAIAGLGHVRSMGDAHGIDKEENERWIVKGPSVKAYILMVLALMNSLMEYKTGKNLVF